MRALVTGAAGMLGRDLVPHLLAQGHEVAAVDRDVDVTDETAVTECVAEVRPDAIFHLAAWTDVDGAEVDEPACHRVNATGTAHVARAAAGCGSALVVVSTDYVFAGDNPSGYDEHDLPDPLGAYGRTKLAGERAALAEHAAGTRIARTAWLYGSGGDNFVDTMLRLGAERDEVRVVTDQTGSPTWTRDLARVLVGLVDLEPGVYHTAGAGSVTWADFARAIFDTAGLRCRVRPVASAEFDRPAPRPAYSALRVSRSGAPKLRPWRDAVGEYISTRPPTGDAGRRGA